MASTRNIISTESAGAQEGQDFNDKSIVPKIHKAVIKRILLGHDHIIRSIMVDYGTVGPTRRGATGYPDGEVVLEECEFITSIKGNYRGSVISDMHFRSNKGNQWGPFGNYTINSTECCFDWRAPDPDMGLLYFSGKADICIRELRANWASYAPVGVPSVTVHYEEHVIENSPTPPDILSKFTRNLMSPTITLVVGEKCVEFHACERILCNLPFFLAAFQGGFKEATEKKITMPEDEPEAVSALIEFLYNGNYTYAYPRTTERSNINGVPIADLREGAFHVRVYAIAGKYICEPLVKAAAKNFMTILQQLNGIDVIRYWKTAYDHGLFLSDWEDDEGLAGFKARLAKLLKQLYGDHREEMETTFAECPALSIDFLRVTVCTGIEA